MSGSDRNHVSLALVLAAGLSGLVVTGDLGAQGPKVTTHTIAVTALEIKGATTIDKLAPPSVNPAELSKGYGFKKPGEADRNAPQRWEVSSYLFAPSAVAVRQGDTVALTAFIVNGDEHEVWITAPDGKRVVPSTVWSRGREYHMQFVAEQPGTYQLTCSNHAPTMTASFLVLPR